MEMKTIGQMLQLFWDDFLNNSRIATAIDRGTSPEEISELSEKEGLHQIDSVLVEIKQEVLQDISDVIEDSVKATETSIHEARKDPPKRGRTAATIDRGASWEKIPELAEKESLHQQEQLRTPL